MLHINNYLGFYIVFEGIYGAGKTTQIGLLKEKLACVYPGIPVAYTCEKGMTNFARIKISSSLDEERLIARERLFLLDKVIRPALQQGELVISEGSVISSLTHASVFDLSIDKIWRINRNVGTTFPDCIIYLDVGQVVTESEEDKKVKQYFLTKSREGYDEVLRKLVILNPSTAIIRVEDENGVLPQNETFRQIWENLEPFLGAWLENQEGKILRERALRSNRKEE